jgi:hypothetical protein
MEGLSGYVPVNLICLLILGALGLRRLVLMDGYHELRVVILTGLLWVPTVYLVLLCVPTTTPCDSLTFDEGNVYTCTEM